MPATAEKKRPRQRPGVLPITIYVPDAMHASWHAFVAKRESTLKAELTMAMQRHIAHPPPPPIQAPPPPVAPLPIPAPVEIPAPKLKRPRGRPKKNS